MAPRSKRKFESDEDTPDHAGSRAPGRGDGASRSIPTPETQRLYDDVRRLEEGLPLHDRLRLQDGPVGDQASHLQPPPHSQAPTSPRSPSCASTTHSLTRALDDAVIEEEEPQNKKRKAQRRGPLDTAIRARAALMRKLGACADCKSRRVRCDHFDNTIFEQQYQRRKQRELGAPVSPQSRGVPAPMSQPSFNDPAVGQIGSWQPPSLPPRYPSGGNQPDAAQVEIDDLLRDIPSGSTGPAAPYYFTTDRLSRLITDPLPTNLLTPQPMPSTPDMASMPLFPPADYRVPIGRMLGDNVFECRHGDDDSPSQHGVCGRPFSTQNELFRHFECNHAPYSDEIAMYKCTKIRFGGDRVERVCGFLSEDDRIPCFQCDGNQWEYWWYASISRTPSLTSGPSVRVGSQDGSAMGGYLPQSQYPYFGLGQGQSNNLDFEMLFPGRYMGGNQGGSYHSYGKKPAAASSDNCFPVYVHPQGCQDGRECRSLESQYTVKGPFLIIISALSLLVMDNWLMVSLRSREIVPAILDTIRNHLFWMSLLCVFVGLVGMWLFKHIRFRLGEGFQSPCDQRCLVRDLFGVPHRRDIENAGSTRGEGDVLVLDMLGQSRFVVR